MQQHERQNLDHAVARALKKEPAAGEKGAAEAERGSEATLARMLSKADGGTRARMLSRLQRGRGNQFIQRLAKAAHGRAEPVQGKIESKVTMPGLIQRNVPPTTAAATATATGTRYRPPPYAAAGRLGPGVVEDIGSTRELVTEIERVLHPAFKQGAAQAMAQVRATYSNDNVRNNAQNMTQGSGLIAGPFTGETKTDNYRGDVTVTATIGALNFERADEAGTLATASQSSAGVSATGGITTGITGTVGGKGGVGGSGQPSAEASGSVAVSQTQSQASTAGMGGATTRTVTTPPGSCLFSTTFTYHITHSFHWDPGTGWSIASLGLVPLMASFMQRDDTWSGYTAPGPGVRVRFPGGDCVPE